MKNTQGHRQRTKAARRTEAIKVHVLGMAVELENGETIRTICPECNGGPTKEKSFAITHKDYVLLYCCHRATCDLQGVIGSGNVEEYKEQEKRKKAIRSYDGELSNFGVILWENTLHKYGLSHAYCLRQGIKYARDAVRLYIPINDARGYQVGELLRALDAERQKPKTLINRTSVTGEMLHFPLGNVLTDTIVLVEDVFSAMKIHYDLGYNVASILGTNVVDSSIEYLKEIGIKTAVLFLDGDKAGRMATCKLLQKLEPHFRIAVALCPNGKDPKDLTTNELKEELAHVYFK